MKEIELKPLDKETQIRVLESVKDELQKGNDSILPLSKYIGLCTLIKLALHKEFNYEIFIGIKNLKIVFPLFAKENAIKQSNTIIGDSGLWWNAYDYENRIKFIDWMLSELNN